MKPAIGSAASQARRTRLRSPNEAIRRLRGHVHDRKISKDRGWPSGRLNRTLITPSPSQAYVSQTAVPPRSSRARSTGSAERRGASRRDRLGDLGRPRVSCQTDQTSTISPSASSMASAVDDRRVSDLSLLTGLADWRTVRERHGSRIHQRSLRRIRIAQSQGEGERRHDRADMDKVLFATYKGRRSPLVRCSVTAVS